MSSSVKSLPLVSKERSKPPQLVSTDPTIPLSGMLAELYHIPTFIQRLGLTLDELSLTRIKTYCNMLLHWGNSINLISKHDLHPERLLQRHIYDCLAVQTTPLFSKPRIWLDIGSGAGLPGLLLAICQPNCQITCLDSSHKKTTFQTEVVRKLALENVSIVCDNADQLEKQAAWQQSFDGIICRAFASLTTQLKLAASFLKPNGLLFSMQGKQHSRKCLAINPLKYGFQLHDIYQYPDKPDKSASPISQAAVLVFIFSSSAMT